MNTPFMIGIPKDSSRRRKSAALIFLQQMNPPPPPAERRKNLVSLQRDTIQGGIESLCFEIRVVGLLQLKASRIIS
jgi:hypothetical protein